MSEAEPALERELTLAFAPLHKRAFGMAIGMTAALVVFLATLGAMLLPNSGRLNLNLLAQYFYGYSVSVPGAFIGAFWAAVAGFVGGWFLAFARNFFIATYIFVQRTRAELRATRDFLDHI